jgi:subtilisin family serine protease
MNHLDLVKLTALMELTSGRPEIIVGLIDGPVLMNHPDLVGENIREIPGKLSGTCAQASSTACMHGTFVAGILCARRNSLAPAICPNCTLLVRPIFAEATSEIGQTRSERVNSAQGKPVESLPSSTPEELAEAIIDCVNAGARVINLSAALAQPSTKGERELEQALDYAARRSVIVVAAAGNQGTVGSSAITRHPWVIPVVACDIRGRPISYSNLGNSIGRRGLSAPGDNITSLGVNGKPLTLGGTSAAAPFVTGTIALLCSELPSANAAQVKLAVTHTSARRRVTVVPPLLDAWGAYQVMPVLSTSA